MELERIDELHVKYDGVIWSRKATSKYYYHHYKWKESPKALHRKIYEDAYGEIPKGCHIHHKDGDTENNSPSNLECMDRVKHAREFWANPQYKEEQDKVRSKHRQRCSSASYRKMMSDAQKNRKKTEHTCLLCGEKFESRCNSSRAKWCSNCYSHQTSDKGVRYFPKKWQMERFGEIKIEPGTSLSMIK